MSLDRERWREQVAENSSRLAFAWGTSTTTGPGAEVHAESIDFGLAFMEKPMFSYGFCIVSDDDFEDEYFPQSSGFVTDWEIDGKGLYVGAHVGVNVVCMPNDVLEHHFGFTGTGLKTIGINV